MRVYALVETGDDQAVDLFLRHEDADALLPGASEMSRHGSVCWL
jgi:hypothetical protein